MTRLAFSIEQLARLPEWEAIKDAGEYDIAVGDEQITVRLKGYDTGVGRMRLIICPRCGAARRHLYGKDGELGCRGCFGLLYPDQCLSGSHWDRQVVRRARTIKRIEHQLQRKDLERNHRRRLRRRHRRLMAELKQVLAEVAHTNQVALLLATV